MSAVGIERRKAHDGERPGGNQKRTVDGLLQNSVFFLPGDQSAGSHPLFCVWKLIGANHC